MIEPKMTNITEKVLYLLVVLLHIQCTTETLNNGKFKTIDLSPISSSTTIDWPEETDILFQNPNRDAIYDHSIRDEMQKRVDIMQFKINQKMGSPEERAKLGEKILQNYQMQRSMKEMQRSLDQGELREDERKEIQEKLTKMVQEIKDERNSEDTLIEEVLLKKQSVRSKRSSFSSNTPDPSNSADTVPKPSIKSKPSLIDEHDTTASMLEKTGSRNKKERWQNVEIPLRLKETLSSILKERAEKDMMDHMMRVGFKGFSRKKNDFVSKSKTNNSKSSETRKRRSILKQSDNQESLQKSKLTNQSAKDSQVTEMQEMSEALKTTISSFFDDVPVTKTFYEFCL